MHLIAFTRIAKKKKSKDEEMFKSLKYDEEQEWRDGRDDDASWE